MLRNYLTTALRNFIRQPIYSAINVSGLVLGLASSIFIFLWVIDELSYDRYHKENDRVFKIMQNHLYSDGRLTTDDWTNGLLGEGLKAELPEIEEVMRLSWSETKLFSFGEIANYEYGDYADQSIFSLFNIALIEGDHSHALPDNNSVAISKKMAIRYFKNEKALGKVFRVDNTRDLTVTAVFEDRPKNSSYEFEFILPFEIYIRNEFTGSLAEWDGSGWLTTFVKLKQKDMQQQVDSKIADFIKKNQKASSSPPPPPFLFSMTEWRLRNNFVNAKQSGGRITYVISFTVVAIFILVIACINFMNLSTARSANRSREVGIRKVAGASRSVLIRQFLIESVLLSFLSLLFALMIVHALLPMFNSFTEKNMRIDYMNPAVTSSLLGIALLVGVIAGSYPAFFLSSFRPSSVLKGNLQSTFGGANLRKGLVVFQFGLALIIIACTLVVYDQISFIRNKDLGFDKDNVITLKTNEELYNSYEAFRNELLQSPNVMSVAVGAAHPMEINGEGYYDWEGKSDDDDTFFNQASCDYDYLETMGFTFVLGRNFSKQFLADSASFIITEEAARRIGFSNPLGRHIKLQNFDGQIIGVIKDFNNLSIQEASQPTVFSLGRTHEELGRWAGIFIRYEPGKLTEALDYLRGVYKKNAPRFPIQYGFVDQSFEHQFKSELIIGTLSFCFTIIAIIISCLGLFGLASFSAERRSKEIGVRKVLGASVTGLVVLLCRDFTRLIVYGIIVGSPFAYYLMDQFLSRYPYHTDLNLSMFLIPAVSMLLISLSIISYQSIKAAMGNPVDALRGE